MSRPRVGLLVPLVAALVLMGGPALAAWVVTGPNGDVASKATSLSPPTSASTTVTGSSVALSWAAPVGGPAPTGYTVQRTAPTTAAVCVAVATTSCTDSGLSPTTSYTYAVTA